MPRTKQHSSKKVVAVHRQKRLDNQTHALLKEFETSLSGFCECAHEVRPETEVHHSKSEERAQEDVCPSPRGIASCRCAPLVSACQTRGFGVNIQPIMKQVVAQENRPTARGPIPCAPTPALVLDGPRTGTQPRHAFIPSVFKPEDFFEAARRHRLHLEHGDAVQHAHRQARHRSREGRERSRRAKAIIFNTISVSDGHLDGGRKG